MLELKYKRERITSMLQPILAHCTPTSSILGMYFVNRFTKHCVFMLLLVVVQRAITFGYVILFVDSINTLLALLGKKEDF